MLMHVMYNFDCWISEYENIVIVTLQMQCLTICTLQFYKTLKGLVCVTSYLEENTTAYLPAAHWNCGRLKLCP